MKTETVKVISEDLTMSERVLMCIIWISSTFTAVIFASIGYMLLSGTAHAKAGSIRLEHVDAESTLIQHEPDDWFAQDVDSNVWYFSEISRNFEDGFQRSLDGSFKVSVEGAKSVQQLRAMVLEGDVYRHEFALE